MKDIVISKVPREIRDLHYTRDEMQSKGKVQGKKLSRKTNKGCRKKFRKQMEAVPFLSSVQEPGQAMFKQTSKKEVFSAAQACTQKNLRYFCA